MSSIMPNCVAFSALSAWLMTLSNRVWNMSARKASSPLPGCRRMRRSSLVSGVPVCCRWWDGR